MIRLPLTSISLSKADVEHHLNNINTYQSLLRQGYKRTDVLQYLDSHNRSRYSNAHEIPYVDTVTLACQRGIDKGPADIRNTSDISRHTDFATSVTDGTVDGMSDAETRRCEHQIRALINDDTISPSLEALDDVECDESLATTAEQSKSVNKRRKHLPRQSSLLRYTESSSRDTGEGEITTKALPTDKPLNQHGNEASGHEPSAILQSRDVAIEKFEHLALDDAPGLITSQESDQSNEALRHPFGTLPGISSQSLTSPHVPDSLELNQASLEAGGSTRGSGPGARTYSMEAVVNFPTSPSTQDSDSGQSTTTHDAFQQFSRSGSLAYQKNKTKQSSQASDSTPKQTQQLVHSSTKSTTQRHHRIDDLAFVVYDDSLGADVQPQTPAELYPHRRFDESSVSFNTTPGVLSYALSGPQFRPQPHATDASDLSPAVRAMDMRNRRNREYRRSVLVEGFRLFRSRRRSHIHGEHGGLNPSQVVVAAHEQYGELWRDELEADRVGEENFDLEDVDPLPLLDTEVDREVGRNRRNQIG